MRHDIHLATVPPAPHVLRAAPLSADPRRAMEIEVWVHYIGSVLLAAPELLPFDAARRLVQRLDESGAAQVRRGAVSTQIQLLGVTASTDGGDYALLRNWETAAMSRIRGARP